MEEITCKRCGRCCHYILDGKIKKCKYLIVHGKTTSCRIYKHRIGTIVTPMGNRCGYRKDSIYNFEGCPYNKLYPDKPMFPNQEDLNNKKPK